MDSRDKDKIWCIWLSERKDSQGQTEQAQLKLFIQAYNMACVPSMQMDCSIIPTLSWSIAEQTEKLSSRPPKMKFEHASPPRKSDILKAKKG